MQKFIFPEGVTYNREKELFLTSKVNTLFEPIARLNSITGGDKQKQDGINTVLSNWVGPGIKGIKSFLASSED